MKIMKQFVFHTERMYTGFGNEGFIHANLIQNSIYKKKPTNKQKNQTETVRTFFKINKYVGSSSNNGNPEKRLNIV